MGGGRSLRPFPIPLKQTKPDGLEVRDRQTTGRTPQLKTRIEMRLGDVQQRFVRAQRGGGVKLPAPTHLLQSHKAAQTTMLLHRQLTRAVDRLLVLQLDYSGIRCKKG